MRVLQRMGLVFLLILLIFDCAARKKYWQDYPDDKLEFLEEDEPGQQSLTKSSEKKPEAEQPNLSPRARSNNTNTDGIYFLDSRDRARYKTAAFGKNGSQIETGKASYYSDKLHGKKTASGEPYDRTKLTAAHRTLKFGTKVKVTNLANNRSVVVRINDRGPAIKARIIDLSRAAAEQIGVIQAGVADVRIEILTK